MTQDEFQNRFHDFSTRDKAEADSKCAEVNAEGIDGNYAVVVVFPGLGFCLMLKSAADFLGDIGIGERHE